MQKISSAMLQKHVIILFCLTLIFSPFNGLASHVYANDDDSEESTENIAEEQAEDDEANQEEENPDGDSSTNDSDEIIESENDSGENNGDGTSEEGSEEKESTQTAENDEESDGTMEGASPKITSFGGIQPLSSSDYDWVDNPDGTVMITKYTGSDTDLTIPDQLDGKDVTVIENAVFRSKNLTSVEIPDSVTELGNQTFDNNALTSVDIPDNVTKIGVSTFADNNLTSIDIPNSITEIGTTAFAHNDLTSIDIPSNVTDVGNFAFRHNDLTEVTIHNAQTVLKDNVFKENQADAADLTIHGYSSSTAEDYANGYGYTFQSLDASSDYDWVENPDGTVMITEYTGNDTDLTIPDQLDGKDVTVIRNQAFQSKNLTSVEIPEGITKIGSSAFSFNELTSVEIPSSVTEIGAVAFTSNELTDVTIYNAQTDIKSNVFVGNQLISSFLTIHGYSQSTAEVYATSKAHMFHNLNANSDGDFEFDDNVDGTVTITNYTGSDTDLTIPDQLDGKDVTVIGENAFLNKGLTKVNFPDGITEIEQAAFIYNDLKSVKIPDGITEIKTSVFRSNDLTSVEIPESVTVIGFTAFSMNNLTNVEFPEGVTEIGVAAFRDNNLTSVEIPEGVTEIVSSTFAENNLTSVEIPDDVKEIGMYAFRYNNLTEIEIPDKVTKIGNQAFNHNDLNEVTIFNVQVDLADLVFENNQSDPADLTIFGYSPSTAETYANIFGYTFKDLDEYPIAGEDVTAIYVDEDGIEIAPSETHTGDIDEDYSTDAKDIPGYTLTDTPDNADGTFTNEAQEVEYVYAKDPVAGEDVTAVYVDEDGIEIAPSEAHTGNVGEDYSTDEKDISGYTLTDTPSNADGTFTNEAQEVEYVYAKDPVAGEDVTAVYVDEDGIEIAPSETHTGNVGEDYSTDEKDISGYTLTDTPSNADGTFTDETQEVEYVYAKDPVAGEDVTAVYVDEDGIEIAPSEAHTGNVGEDYSTDEKDISGYTLTDTPSNADGTFTNEAQEVEYVYAKDPVAGEDVTAVYVDEDGIEIAPSETHTGNVGEDYSTNEKDISGYTLTDTPSNADGTFTNETQEVKYVYAKDDENGDGYPLDVPDVDDIYGGDNVATGTGEPGAMVHITANDGVVGTGVIDADGNFEITLDRPAVAGEKFIFAQFETDEDGHTISESTSDPVSVIVQEGEEPGNGEEPENGDGSEEVEVTVGNEGSDNKEGSKDALPSTATSTFNWLLGGFIVMLVGATGVFVRKRKEGTK